jgi:hypothetical protein
MGQRSELVIALAACFVRAMGTPGRATRGLSAPLRAALLMLLATPCVAGMTCTIRIAVAELHPGKFALFRNLFGRACLLPFTGAEPLTAPPARPGV